MNLAVDIGNTEITFGLYQNNILLQKWQTDSDRLVSPNNYFKIIYNYLVSKKISTKSISGFAVSSVVPQLTKTFSQISKDFFQLEPFVLTALTRGIGLKFLVKEPSFIGSDLIANAISAVSKYPNSCIVCDIGTATTVQLVGSDGTFFGAAIAPGIRISIDALFSRAAKIREFELFPPDKLLGLNTQDAIASGSIAGTGIMLEGFIDRLKKEYELSLGRLTSVLTGGMSNLVKQTTDVFDIVDNNLTLDGLNIAMTKR